MADRRSFLRGLVSLPLVGGGVTLIGAPSAPVPLVQAAALPALSDPRQRARYAWEAFSGAMREITADADGWCLPYAGEQYRAADGRPAGAFMIAAAVRMTEHRHPTRPDPFWCTTREEFTL